MEIKNWDDVRIASRKTGIPMGKIAKIFEIEDVSKKMVFNLL
jgi:hypothetical protein